MAVAQHRRRWEALAMVLVGAGVLALLVALTGDWWMVVGPLATLGAVWLQRVLFRALEDAWWRDDDAR